MPKLKAVRLTECLLPSVQNHLLCSLSNKVKVHRTARLPVILYRCETVREQQRLRVMENQGRLRVLENNRGWGCLKTTEV